VRKTNLKIILHSPSWLDLTVTKQRREWRKLFHGGNIIFVLMAPSGNKSPYRHVNEDANIEIVTLIFNGATMEMMIPPLPFAITEEEKEKIKLKY